MLDTLVRRPFAHLEVNPPPSDNVDLTVSLWDEAGAPDLRTEGQPRFEMSTDGRFVVSRLGHSMSCMDRERTHIVGFAADARHLSPYERGRPLHVPLSIWHADVEVPLFHAGLVTLGEAGILLTGPAGAGKTTAALGCLCAGLGYLGDDLVGMEAARDVFLGHSIYGSSFVDPRSLEWLPAFHRHPFEGQRVDEKKQLLFPAEIFPSRMRRVCEIRAVVLLHVVEDSRRRLEVRPASKAEALLALAPSSLLVRNLSPGRSGFEKLVSLVERVPRVWFELGADVERIPEEIRRLCHSSRTTPGGRR